MDVRLRKNTESVITTVCACRNWYDYMSELLKLAGTTCPL